MGTVPAQQESETRSTYFWALKKLQLTVFFSLASVCITAFAPSLMKSPRNYYEIGFFVGAAGFMLGVMLAHTDMNFRTNVYVVSAEVQKLICGFGTIFAFNNQRPIFKRAICGKTIFNFGLAVAEDVSDVPIKTMAVVFIQSFCFVCVVFVPWDLVENYMSQEEREEKED